LATTLAVTPQQPPGTPRCSGYDRVDCTYAKRLALTSLEAVLQTQLGVFFAANLAASCYAGSALATKALFLGRLTAYETSQLADRLLKFVLLKVAFLAAVQSPGFGSLWQVSGSPP
jgi:hypothetical protein